MSNVAQKKTNPSAAGSEGDIDAAVPHASRIHSTPRFDTRKTALKACFSVPAMERVWQRYVKKGMRDQDFVDLHDYNDFHRNRRNALTALRSEILTGKYRPKSPMPVRLEKKSGVSRRICVPTVEDAIVLQSLVEHVLKDVLNRQPSQNAFFSRSHGFSRPTLNFGNALGYLWFTRWKEFSKKREEIATNFDYLVITDIANYFDTIDLRQLRNVLSSIISSDEVILDLIFMIIDAFIWKPDYIIPSAVGLPQVNFDPPRLLSHAYLYEVDTYLESRTNGNFLRWVDDITIAVKSEQDGRNILGSLDEIMISRGLRLNLGKTIILTAREAHQYLWIDENAFLEQISTQQKKLGTRSSEKSTIRKKLRTRFNKFRSAEKYGHWDKIYKRYYSEFAHLKDGYMEQFCSEDLTKMPMLRDSAFRYLSMLGPSESRLQILSSFLSERHISDESSIFSACRVIVSWKIPISENTLIDQIIVLSKRLANSSFVEQSIFYLFGSLWIAAKYGSIDILEAILWPNRVIWQRSSFVARQVAALTPRLRKESPIAIAIRDDINKFGHQEAQSVLQNLDALSKATSIDSDELKYLCYESSDQSSYPLQKILLGVAFMKSDSLLSASRSNLQKNMKIAAKDEVYSRILDASIY